MMHDYREEVLRSKLTYALSLLTVVTDFMSSPSQCGTSLIVPIDWQCDCIGNSLGNGICPAVSLCPAEVGKSISVNLIAAHLLISFHHKPKANRLWKFSHLLAKRGGGDQKRENVRCVLVFSDAIFCDMHFASSPVITTEL